MKISRIKYLTHRWDISVGCSGKGCAVREPCWANALSRRGRFKCSLCNSFTPHFHDERLAEPLYYKQPARIGVSFLGDLFDPAIEPWQHNLVFYVARLAYWHTFICLTKQPQNVNAEMVGAVPSNFWLGVSINTTQDLWRLEKLRGINAPRRIISAEPLLSDLGNVNLKGISWLIIGAQTRPRIQPKSEWVQALIDQADKRAIPVFVKNNMNGWIGLQKYPREVEAK